jgi:hypothetical protein
VPERSVRRALLNLGDRGGPLPEPEALQLVHPHVVAELLRRGLLTISVPVYSLTTDGVRAYMDVANDRNEGTTE